MKHTHESLALLTSTPEGLRLLDSTLAALCGTESWLSIVVSNGQETSCQHKTFLEAQEWLDSQKVVWGRKEGPYANNPRYTKDLNAVQDTVLKLIQSKDQKNAFVNYLDDLAANETDEQLERDFLWCNSTAIQRCIALILTLQEP